MPLQKFIASVLSLLCSGFVVRAASFFSSSLLSFGRPPLSPSNYCNFQTSLFGNGKGFAENYSWIENRKELEVTVKVPRGTRSKDIKFKTTPYSVDLRLALSKDEKEVERVLLSGERQLRGKLRMDGTYWSIEDADSGLVDDILGSYREVKVSIEKHRFLAEVECDDDWGGVFLDDKDEVKSREYEEDEELDIEEYTKRLGIDVNDLKSDDIDQSMFSAMNMTQGTLEKVLDSGFAREVLKEQERVDNYISNTPKTTLPKMNTEEIQDVTSETSSSTELEVESIDQDPDFDEEEEIEVEIFTPKEISLESYEETIGFYLKGIHFMSF